ncbi:precorrin-6y C5,15-methyltransferase (decarboxylating) subunit CbiE [Paenibacillus oenotherae]|uniref:Precorrin-6y C5,15-methyltransferase (Decarboxylating) subunit CbiE n=1 Tax=Paenibacillus oenotherae TaxID=1435645 RepID=A0ABS7D349_9BACL|nr:precorrin-6y C5,15-methyltransferase (decarboxylating) subunit CbiE [Paenibacillus oenotherae]MBW7474347.1 precorrin-6y C5,15-methyltransferase (decarboxylating) subunit CbiE [Paenibacillus oenotherae]
MGEPIKVIGIGDDGAAGLLPVYLKWIQESAVLVGGERQLSFFSDYRGEKITVKSGLSDLVSRLSAETGKTVVLASGDPLFYGIGGYLAARLDVEIYPHVSALQLAFARMGESWQDAYVTSVHGRSIKGLAQRIDGRSKVALLTDENNSPQVIADYLLHFGMTEYRAFVAENLEGPDERIGWYSLQEMREGSFSPLNMVILKRDSEPQRRWPLGIPDEEFSQRKPDKGLITKREIRVLTLAQLGLHSHSIVWDIGTCTGSIAIEAGRIAKYGEVYAVEKNEEDLENCRMNSAKFRVDITTLHAKAPNGLDAFPDPDAVFIGGSGGELKELLRLCGQRLRPGGRIVLNAITLENLTEAMGTLKEIGYEASVSMTQISRSKPILAMTRLEGLNPVFIVTASREEEKGSDE